MFNLIVSGRVSGSQRGLIPITRVFKYTTGEVLERVFPGDSPDFEVLCRLPTVLMEEGVDDQEVRVAFLREVVREGSDYSLRYTIDQSMPRLTNGMLKSLQADLEISDFEFFTNHWAVKDVDLFRVLLVESYSRAPRPRVFTLPRRDVNPGLISFMMPFHESFDDVYFDLGNHLRSLGYEVRRADDFWRNDHIMNDVAELISTSSVVVCDLTGKNPNVFYEAGIAHTLGKNVVLITQSSVDVPFDLGPIRHIVYEDTNAGRAQLADAVGRRVGELLTP